MARGTPTARLERSSLAIPTFAARSGVADLRPRTSSSAVVTVDQPPCGGGTSNVTVRGTTLEQPPSQPNGTGFNGSLSAGTVTLAAPLADGASIDLRFLIGIQQTGELQAGRRRRVTFARRRRDDCGPGGKGNGRGRD